jgi:hypothetical protein
MYLRSHIIVFYRQDNNVRNVTQERTPPCTVDVHTSAHDRDDKSISTLP